MFIEYTVFCMHTHIAFVDFVFGGGGARGEIQCTLGLNVLC